jgi:hypothetical protein
MFEAERELTSDFVIIPVYSYVSKRLVDPHLRGWQDNVMDHHPTRHMFKLKSRQPGEPAAPAEVGAMPSDHLEGAGEAPVFDAPDPGVDSHEEAGPETGDAVMIEQEEGES